jgi:hypothetical protein
VSFIKSVFRDKVIAIEDINLILHLVLMTQLHCFQVISIMMVFSISGKLNYLASNVGEPTGTSLDYQGKERTPCHLSGIYLQVFRRLCQGSVTRIPDGIYGGRNDTGHGLLRLPGVFHPNYYSFSAHNHISFIYQSRYIMLTSHSFITQYDWQQIQRPFSKRGRYTVRYTASSFELQYLLVYLTSSSSTSSSPSSVFFTNVS